MLLSSRTVTPSQLYQLTYSKVTFYKKNLLDVNFYIEKSVDDTQNEIEFLTQTMQ